MYTRRILAFVALAALMLTAVGCAADQGLTDQVDQLAAAMDQQSSRIAAVESQVTDLADILENLESDVDALAAEPGSDTAGGAHAPESSVFEVAVAQYFMDTAGFHGIAESLASGDPIDPSWAATVSRAYKLLTSVVWPEELDVAADAFVENVGALSEALANDDAEAAAPLAETVHDAQHELSHSIDDWLGTAGAEHTHEE